MRTVWEALACNWTHEAWMTIQWSHWSHLRINVSLSLWEIIVVAPNTELIIWHASSFQGGGPSWRAIGLRLYKHWQQPIVHFHDWHRNARSNLWMQLAPLLPSLCAQAARRKGLVWWEGGAKNLRENNKKETYNRCNKVCQINDMLAASSASPWTVVLATTSNQVSQSQEASASICFGEGRER